MPRKILTLFWILLLTGTLVAQDVDKIFEGRIEIYFSFERPEDTDIETLSRIVSIDRLSGSEVFAYANKKEFARFLELGAGFTVLQHPGTLHQPRMLDKADLKHINDWDFYPTYDAYVDLMYQFENEFPDICDVFSIGTTNDGRELLVARISDNVGQDENEPEFLYTSTMHGDETTGYVLMLRLIDHLLNGYGSNARLTNLVDEIDIFINPLANPDGTFYGGNNNIYGAIRGNANGIDINRNFPDPEDGPHPDGNPWQTETIHWMNFAEERNFVMSANIHGGTEVCNYPWDTWQHLAADNLWWVYVCREYADTVHLHAPSGYMDDYNNGITNGYQWYTISGGRQDYMTYFHQDREFTLEISDIKLLPANQLPAHWNYNYRSLLNYMEQSLYGIRGRVTDSASGEPLDAEVFVLGHEADSSWVYSSLPAGNFHRMIFDGSYSIRFSREDYFPKTFNNIAVVRKQTTLLDVELVKAISAVAEPTTPALNMYPNPASGNLVKLNAGEIIETVNIYSLGGQLLEQTVGGGSAVFFLDIGTLPVGSYIVEVLTAEGRMRQTLIRR
jgi:hypothetical protein